MKKWALVVFLIFSVISLTTINASTTENPETVTFHSSMKKGADFTWKLALFPAEGAPAPKLGNMDLSDGDLLKLEFMANPPTDWAIYSKGELSTYNEFYLNNVKLDYNEIRSSLAMYMVLYINPITNTFANGTTQSLREQLLQMDVNLGNLVNVTTMPEWSTAEVAMMLPHASLGNYVYTAQIDLNVGILQNNHINIQDNFEMMWTYHNGDDDGTGNAPGFELLPLSVGILVMIFVVKKRK